MNQLPQLPTPNQHPQADVVLFDGNCVFCTNGVQTLHRLDGKNRLAFLSIHDPLVAEKYPDLKFEMLMEQMYVIPHHALDKRYGGAAAIRYLSRRLPKLWIAAPLLHVPFSMPFWQFLYRQVAKRRYRLAKRKGDACESGSCELHFGEQANAKLKK